MTELIVGYDCRVYAHVDADRGRVVRVGVDEETLTEPDVRGRAGGTRARGARDRGSGAVARMASRVRPGGQAICTGPTVPYGASLGAVSPGKGPQGERR